MRIILLCAAVLFAVSAEAASVKIPALYACMSNVGAITVRQKCKAGELKLTGATLSSQGASGPQGPQGPAGPQGPSGNSGTFDPNKCTTRTNANAGQTLVTARVNCAADEMLVTHGMINGYAATDIIEIGLLYPPSGKFAQAVEYKVGVNVPADLTVFAIQAEAVCCKP